MYKNSLKHRVLNIVVAGFLTLLSLCVFPAVVQAAESFVVPLDAEGGQAELPCERGSVRIKLPQGNPYDNPAGGTNKDDGQAGFIFSLTRVDGYDLHNFADLERIKSIRATDILKSALSSEPRKAVTSAEGEVVYEDLPSGLYYAQVASPVAVKNKGAVEDFLLTIPVLDIEGWQCSGTIYAKKVPPYNPIPEPPETTETPEPPTPDLPKTGIEGYGLIAFSSLFLGVGLLLAFTKRINRSKEPNTETGAK